MISRRFKKTASTSQTPIQSTRALDELKEFRPFPTSENDGKLVIPDINDSIAPLEFNSVNTLYGLTAYNGQGQRVSFWFKSINDRSEWFKANSANLSEVEFVTDNNVEDAIIGNSRPTSIDDTVSNIRLAAKRPKKKVKKKRGEYYPTNPETLSKAQGNAKNISLSKAKTYIPKSVMSFLASDEPCEDTE